jgi:hypothetical protein
VVLNDGGDEAAGFLKVEIHSSAIKKPAGGAGGRPFSFRLRANQETTRRVRA